MMKRFLAVRLVAFPLFVVGILAQTPTQMPKPGQEHQRLSYFEGNWSKEGNIKPNPFLPAGKFTANEHNEWMTGGFFLVSHDEWKLPTEQWTGLAVIGYDAEEGVYTEDEYSSTGEANHFRGAVAGNAWTWTAEKKIGPNGIKTRVTMKQLSPNSYAFRGEVLQLPEGREWLTFMEGNATKIK
jgi:hypothetical protein